MLFLNDITINQTDDFFDFSNPQHFINLVPPRVKEEILKIPKDLLLLPETKLISRIYEDAIPDDLDYQLRLSFWDEYESRFKKCEEMRVNKIIEGVCSLATFYQNVITNHGRLLFIITQPSVVNNRLKYAFHLSMSEMIKLLKAPTPINSKTGVPDGKILDTKYKIFEYLDQRLHGSIIQRQSIEQKSLNINVDATSQQLPQTPDAIDQRLMELESEFRTIELPPRQAQISPNEILSPMERVVIEAGRVTADFTRQKTER